MNLHERDISKAAERKGFLIGSQQTAEKTAKNFLKMKILTYEQISLGTGLSIDQIKKLEKDN